MQVQKENVDSITNVDFNAEDDYVLRSKPFKQSISVVSPYTLKKERMYGIPLLQNKIVYCNEKLGVIRANNVECSCCKTFYNMSNFIEHSNSSSKKPWISIKLYETDESINEIRKRFRNENYKKPQKLKTVKEIERGKDLLMETDTEEDSDTLDSCNEYDMIEGQYFISASILKQTFDKTMELIPNLKTIHSLPQIIDSRNQCNTEIEENTIIQNSESEEDLNYNQKQLIAFAHEKKLFNISIVQILRDKLICVDLCKICGTSGFNYYVRCDICAEIYHPFCLPIINDHRPISDPVWRCLQCKVCRICEKFIRFQIAIECKICHCYYHKSCINIKSKLDINNYQCTQCPMVIPRTFISKIPQNFAYKRHVYYKDQRTCGFCHRPERTDEPCDRLLPALFDMWVHANCIIWATGIVIKNDGEIVNFTQIFKTFKLKQCNYCQIVGANLKCGDINCDQTFHFPCAWKKGICISNDHIIYCSSHIIHSKFNIESFENRRFLYIPRESIKSLDTRLPIQYRIGNLTVLWIGKPVWENTKFYSKDIIYPLGYKVIRSYWSISNPTAIIQYICEITSRNNQAPIFSIVPLEDARKKRQNLFIETAYIEIMRSINYCREIHNMNLLPLTSGIEFFGLNEPWMIKSIEGIPESSRCYGYQFRYVIPFKERTFLELSLSKSHVALNASECARLEPFVKKPTPKEFAYIRPNIWQIQDNIHESIMNTIKFFFGNLVIFDHKIRIIASDIHRYGIKSTLPLKNNSIVGEFIGEIIEKPLALKRWNQYQKEKLPNYFFQIDEDNFIDATKKGNNMRFINHSCQPNCVSILFDVNETSKIMIYAIKDISIDQEITIDYRPLKSTENILCLCKSDQCNLISL